MRSVVFLSLLLLVSLLVNGLEHSRHHKQRHPAAERNKQLDEPANVKLEFGSEEEELVDGEKTLDETDEEIEGEEEETPHRIRFHHGNRRRENAPHHGHHSRGRSKWLPDWAAPWIKGSLDLSKAFNIDWDMASFFDRENKQWWKGPNMCVTREETEEAVGTDGGREIQHHHFATASRCDETETSYMCTTEVTFYDKKKYYTVVYECCHGFQRIPGESGCTEALELKDVEQTVRELGSREFAHALESMGLDQMLEHGNFTIFAPSDEAFDAYQPTEEIDSNIIIISPELRSVAEHTQGMLLAHIAPGLLKTSKLHDELLVETENPHAKIRINIYDVPRKLVTANCVPLLSSDNQAIDGVVHTLDGSLTPVEDTLADLVASDPQLSTLKSMLGKMGVVRTLKSPGQFTLFAPTNAAFKRLKASLLEKLVSGNNCLLNMIQNHMLPNTICSSIIEGRVKTRNIENMHLNLTRTAEDKLFVNGAQLVKVDVMGTNGVMHIIDEVLIPDGALDLLDVAEKAGATEFLRLVDAAGLTKTLQRMENMTLFLPTNQAVQKLAEDVRAELASDPMALEKIVKFHVSTSGEVYSNHLHNNMRMNTMGTDKTILIKEFTSSPFGLRQQQTAQCSTIIKKDISSCNGVAHVVNQMLIPPKGDILDILSIHGNFSRLVQLLKTADLSEDMQEQGPFTFFAPTNEALAAVNQDELRRLEKDAGRLRGFLRHHIIKGTLCCSGVFDSPFLWKQTEWTLEESILRVGHRHGKVMVNRNAPLARCDMTATNGVVHAASRVINEAWEKYVGRYEYDPDADGQRHSRIMKMFDMNWDRVLDHLPDMEWMDAGYRWDKGRK